MIKDKSFCLNGFYNIKIEFGHDVIQSFFSILRILSLIYYVAIVITLLDDHV